MALSRAVLMNTPLILISLLLWFTETILVEDLKFCMSSLLICFIHLLHIEDLPLNDPEMETLTAAVTPRDRSRHDNCTIVLTKALSRLQFADKKVIILFVILTSLQSFMWHHEKVCLCISLWIPWKWDSSDKLLKTVRFISFVHFQLCLNKDQQNISVLSGSKL